MRYKLLVVTPLFAAALVASCGMMEENAAVEPAPSGAAEEKLDVAIAATQVAAQALKGYAFAQRAQFASDRKAAMGTMEAELIVLSVKAESANEAAKANAKAKLDAVRARWTEAKRQLDLVESATESSWDDVQSGFNKSYGELQAAFDETRQWMSDEIEP